MNGLRMRRMTAPMPYLHFPGTAREALAFYGDVFGCAVEVTVGATDGQVIERYGLHWLIGFEAEESS